MSNGGTRTSPRTLRSSSPTNEVSMTLGYRLDRCFLVSTTNLKRNPNPFPSPLSTHPDPAAAEPKPSARQLDLSPPYPPPPTYTTPTPLTSAYPHFPLPSLPTLPTTFFPLSPPNLPPTQHDQNKIKISVVRILSFLFTHVTARGIITWRLNIMFSFFFRSIQKALTRSPPLQMLPPLTSRACRP